MMHLGVGALCVVQYYLSSRNMVPLGEIWCNMVENALCSFTQGIIFYFLGAASYFLVSRLPEPKDGSPLYIHFIYVINVHKKFDFKI